MKTGIRIMSDAAYFADPAIDQTSLKRFLVSPKAYAEYLTGERKPSSVLEFGKAAHSLVLCAGPAVLVKPSLRTKAGKQEYEDLQAAHSGEDIVWVSQDDYDAVHRMADEVRSYFEGVPGRPELALFADDPETGLRLKGKADWLPDEPDEDGVLRIRDYKTTVKSPMEFGKSAWMFGYHIQAAFYMRLYRWATGYAGPLGFDFVVQEKQPPYDWMVWRFQESDPEMEIAGQQIDHALKGIKSFHDMEDPLEAMRSYGLPHYAQDLHFPDWKLLELEEEVESWR